MLALGLMSGTSLDGVDAALIETDGLRVAAMGRALTRPYGAEERAALRGVLGGVGDVAAAERLLTDAHVAAVQALLGQAGLSAAAVDVVGFHGQTILHRPDQRRTWQIGDGARLAAETGIRVVNDFRTPDVAAGGQGAPLVPVYHQALARDLAGEVAVLNLGGVGNVTWIGGDGGLLAFDTGPGNALMDDWALDHTGVAVDKDGALASAGTVDKGAVASFAAHPYFAQPAPKSLDRDDFQALAQGLVAGMSAADGAATLAAFTVEAVALALAWLPRPPGRWLVTGGGRHNPVLMAGLAARLGVPVQPVEAVGWDGDAMEAQAFAYLAVRSLMGLPITYPETTGAPRPLTAGRLHHP
jgi:anhydro-N-acetylmuramic acid kinase